MVQIHVRAPKIMIFLIFTILHSIFAIFIAFLIIAFFTGAPFVPSSKKTALKMAILAQIPNGAAIYDLGSGDGRLLLLAMQYGASRAVGYEINPFLVVFSRLRVFFSPYKSNISIQWKNFWNADVTSADIVFIYLLPWRMESLKELLATQLKPGSQVVSNSFIFPGWKPVRSDPPNHVYVFEMS